MIYDFTKGISAIFFSKLLQIDYEFHFDEYELSKNELEFDEIGYFNKSEKNGFSRLGMFLPSYNNTTYNRDPALHIFNCKNTDALSGIMKVSNSSKNTYFSRDENKKIEANLEICKECTKNLRKKFKINLETNYFNDFVLAIEESKNRQTITDSKGYIINWKQVSYCFRDIKNFTCESCGFKAKFEFEKKFLHTHHIDRNKKNNFRNNLKCLCVECHANVDDFHKEKFKFDGFALLLDFQNYKKNDVADLQSVTSKNVTL